MEKPKKPIEPNVKDYPLPKEPNDVNVFGKPIRTRPDFTKAFNKWQKDLKKYNADMEIYNQLKLIRLIKNSTEKYCLKNFKITKTNNNE